MIDDVTTGSYAFLIDAEALRLEASRKRLYTDGAIAQAIGCTPSMLSRVLRRKQLPSNELLAHLLRFFGRKGYDRIVKLVVC